MGSARTTFVAIDGPSFATVIVKVRFVPCDGAVRAVLGDGHVGHGSHGADDRGREGLEWSGAIRVDLRRVGDRRRRGRIDSHLEHQARGAAGADDAGQIAEVVDEPAQGEGHRAADVGDGDGVQGGAARDVRRSRGNWIGQRHPGRGRGARVLDRHSVLERRAGYRRRRRRGLGGLDARNQRRHGVRREGAVLRGLSRAAHVLVREAGRRIVLRRRRARGNRGHLHLELHRLRAACGDGAQVDAGRGIGAGLDDAVHLEGSRR